MCVTVVSFGLACENFSWVIGAMCCLYEWHLWTGRPVTTRAAKPNRKKHWLSALNSPANLWNVELASCLAAVVSWSYLRVACGKMAIMLSLVHLSMHWTRQKVINVAFFSEHVADVFLPVEQSSGSWWCDADLSYQPCLRERNVQR